MCGCLLLSIQTRNRFGSSGLTCTTLMCKFERLVSTGIADETRETGEWKAIQGKSYYSIDATLSGDAYHQEAASYPIPIDLYRD